MSSVVNFTKYLKKKYYKPYTNFFRKKGNDTSTSLMK